MPISLFASGNTSAELIDEGVHVNKRQRQQYRTRVKGARGMKTH
jgi:hypothetical protein